MNVSVPRKLCLGGALESVDYVILYVEDLVASIGFYRDVIGLPFRFEDHGYAEFSTQGTKFALYQRSGLPELIGREAGHDGPAGEILFLVDNVDAETERLRELGAEILSGPLDRPWGHRTLHLLDPDGFVVELAQEIPRQQPRAR
jgi:lactoylglutathione lyase